MPDKDPAQQAEEQKMSPEMLQQDAKMKQSYEEFHEVIRAHSSDPIMLLDRKDEMTAE